MYSRLACFALLIVPSLNTPVEAQYKTTAPPAPPQPNYAPGGHAIIPNAPQFSSPSVPITPNRGPQPSYDYGGPTYTPGGHAIIPQSPMPPSTPSAMPPPNRNVSTKTFDISPTTAGSTGSGLQKATSQPLANYSNARQLGIISTGAKSASASSSGNYTFNQTTSNTIQVLQNGKVVSTTSLGNAETQYGYVPSSASLSVGRSNSSALPPVGSSGIANSTPGILPNQKKGTANIGSLAGSSIHSASVTASQGSAEVFPLAKRSDEKTGYHVNTSFLANGSTTDNSNPNQYIKNDLHVGVDLKAAANTAVYAPVGGTIVYYHTKGGNGQVNSEQTFIVLRGENGRDYVVGHVQCTVCKGAGVGDGTAFPADQVTQNIKQGQKIGVVEDLHDPNNPVVGPHLHFGENTGQIVDGQGLLKPEYRSGQWGILKYTEGNASSLQAAKDKAVKDGWVDPLKDTSTWNFQ